jgi:nitroreductase
MLGFVKRLLKSVLPEPALAGLRYMQSVLHVIQGGIYDTRRYLRWRCREDKPAVKEQLAAVIMIDAHRIEKGLSLREPRVAFGQAVISRLLKNGADYLEKYGTDDIVAIARDSLLEYCRFNRDAGNDVSELEKKVNTIWTPENTGDAPGAALGGTLAQRRDTIQQAGRCDFAAFLASRHSVRHFEERLVDPDEIRAAVCMARQAPSVCNRQSFRAHLFQGEDAARVLNLQNGNRGFGDHIGTVIAVSSDLRTFAQPGERYQSWIDGGIFAITLTYSLHSLGLGTCVLNWCVNPADDRELKKVTGIPAYENVVCLIVTGYLPAAFRVTRSRRKPVDELLAIH